MSGFPANDAASTDAESTRLLAVMARRIAASLDLRETLRIVAASVVDQLGFGCAVVNMTRPGDLCEVVAVAGSPEAAAALLGTCAPMDTWRKLLADCEPWGELRFLDHRSDQRHARSIAGWVPPVDPPGGRRPDARRRQLLEQFAVHAALAIEHARAHTFLARSEQLFRAMFDRSPIAIALLTEDERITRVNEAFEKLLGRDSAALLGRTATELRRPDSVPARRGTDAAGPPAGQYEIHFTRPDGRPVWGRVNSTLLAAEAGGGDPGLVLTQIEDITIQRTMQARFAHAATHDRLTGLPNRTLVLDRLESALTEAGRGQDRVAAFYCDLDRFKEINDTLGHAAGDQMLVEAGRRLSQAAREQDTVGRLGGDEFIVISHPVPSTAELIAIASRLVRAVQRPFALRGEKIALSVSVGAALSAPHDDADSLLANADRALYAAKAAGGDGWRLAVSG